ncbi:hypothetical protein EAI89_17110 [Eubacterium sp. am_0171]|jgi:hypothetical protein|uniref:hypothetical protein n=1 Tax=unclassified Eubacterium (in: firmicutes) TaxID=2624479 RepID=UPI00102077A7|nr:MULTISPECIES: hypothetical protein [unclassified Eubacterium (in: firmicutes)]MSD07942.1 hypothetical protein [Eubacterium sp. BIOML-A2]RYT13615.1 hypothetical protein EAI89_17110 [Eubacterium sp. am_0171]
MKGHLDVKQLESYNKADLQELAKQLGVDAEGTKKEIAARCAAVEVDIPDDSELTEEDKKVAAEAAAEAAAKAEEEKAAAEAAAKAEEEKAAAEAVAKAEEEKKAAGLVKVKAKRRFLDKELNQIKDTGDIYTVSRERAAVLEEAGVAVVMTE